MTALPTPVRPVAIRQKVRLGVLLFMVLTFPIFMNYLSVYLIIESAFMGIAVFSLFFWSVWTVTALFLGRAGCGWLCPLGGFPGSERQSGP